MDTSAEMLDLARRRAAAYDDLFAAQQNVDRARSRGVPIPRVRPDRVGRVGGESSIRDASKVAARLHLSPRSPPSGVPPMLGDMADDDEDGNGDDVDSSPSPVDPVLRPRAKWTPSPPLMPPPGHVRERVQAWEHGDMSRARQDFKPSAQYQRSSSHEVELVRVQSTVGEYNRRAASASQGGKGSKGGGSKGDRRRFRDVRDGGGAWQPTIKKVEDPPSSWGIRATAVADDVVEATAGSASITLSPGFAPQDKPSRPLGTKLDGGKFQQESLRRGVGRALRLLRHSDRRAQGSGPLVAMEADGLVSLEELCDKAKIHKDFFVHGLEPYDSAGGNPRMEVLNNGVRTQVRSRWGHSFEIVQGSEDEKDHDKARAAKHQRKKRA